MIKEDEKPCKQCKEVKSLSAFHKRMHLCIKCYNENRDRGYQEQIEATRKAQEEERNREREERKRKAEEQKEEFTKRLEAWYAEQPDQVCKRCRKKRTPKEMGIWGEGWGIWHESTIELRETCKDCRYDQCCLCLQKKEKLVHSFDGYSLTIPGTSHCIKLFCKDCELEFLALPTFRQKMLIRTCSNRTFPPGQVIYAERDPRTQEIRYIGRTRNATRRHTEHMRNAYQGTGHLGEPGTDRYREFYGRSTWMYDLKQLGLKSIQRTLLHVDIPPQVVEWEQRYIWHALQQDWPITNLESANGTLIRKVKDSGLDFLKAPFETLVEHGFFREKGIEAFVRKWYEP